ncbi:MAG: hypothetical protein DHS20C07_20700 [Methyloligella sp.]|nr:MAG: hypothetical protein DHS20C07_20700 [Methyloligella sp.]
MIKNKYYKTFISLFFFAFLFGGVFGGTRALAAELIMVEAGGCHWCEVWDEEIGVIYHRTSAGKIAPLRRVDLHKKLPEDLNFLKQLAFSPTFIVVNKGVEVGRITGYPGESFFWGQLEIILKKLPNEKIVQTKVH